MIPGISGDSARRRPGRDGFLDSIEPGVRKKRSPLAIVLSALQADLRSTKCRNSRDGRSPSNCAGGAGREAARGKREARGPVETPIASGRPCRGAAGFWRLLSRGGALRACPWLSLSLRLRRSHYEWGIHKSSFQDARFWFLKSQSLRVLRPSSGSPLPVSPTTWHRRRAGSLRRQRQSLGQPRRAPRRAGILPAPPNP